MKWKLYFIALYLNVVQSDLVLLMLIYGVNYHTIILWNLLLDRGDDLK